MTGKALRRARLRAGLTQAQLASLAGLTVGTVVRCERPDWPATELTRARLRRALEEAAARPAAASGGFATHSEQET